MFMWPESVASRGSAEIGPSTPQYLKLRASDATHLIVFSDACGGQNYTINIAGILVRLRTPIAVLSLFLSLKTVAHL